MTVIEVEKLRKNYKSKTAVDGISLRVQRGQIVGVAGANGAGKTTLVECMSGLRSRDGGDVRVLGMDPWTQRRQLQQRIGVQLQESALPDALKVGEAFRLYAALYDRGDWRTVMADWDLTDKQRVRFGSLSGGWKQRLLVALALVGDPEIVFLDELTTGLDPVARRTTWTMLKALRERGLTVVLVTHFMDEAEALCDQVLVIADGRVVAGGTPAELIARTATDSLESAYLTLSGAELS
ncbi:ABC transporter ATP-binding protein [Kribbella sp. CA-253562]|uniref:ABC transporter ATP-binding protein n=1 Tax=Kribbella sp. CA-253562 TaxID=3239942 RepID=UPI003D92DFDD